MAETIDAGRRLQLDMDLAKGVFYQGNISLGIFEENRHMKRTIVDLASAAGLSGYVTNFIVQIRMMMRFKLNDCNSRKVNLLSY